MAPLATPANSPPTAKTAGTASKENRRQLVLPRAARDGETGSDMAAPETGVSGATAVESMFAQPIATRKRSDYRPVTDQWDMSLLRVSTPHTDSPRSRFLNPYELDSSPQ
jgi:hypothetical protein